MEIKDSLLTPKTSFAMKGNLTNKEPEYQKNWMDNDIYNKRRKLNEGKELFLLLDGPPYANGDLHVGHALNKTLKDFIWRYKSMSGYDVPITLGWDTHGLPIENALLKKKKIKRDELTDVEFRDLCKEYALNQVNNQKEQFMRLGLLADGKSTYKTLEKEYEAEQIRVFSKMAMDGLIYKGLKPVYWSPTSQSALAEAEVEYKDKQSFAIYVGFDIIGDDRFVDTQAVIFTTTPWTIPANMGISVGRDFEYDVIEISNKKYLLAKELVKDFAAVIGNEYKVLDTFVGNTLEHTKIHHPIFDKESFIMIADHVTLDVGTGMVHTAPGHGEDDFIVGKKYGLEVLSVVDYKGTMTEDAGKFAGEFYEKANQLIIDELEENGHLINVSTITHSYPHDWRTKKPIIFRATAQWFASIDKVKEQLLTEISNVNWINSWGEVRLSNMIKDRVDWCISRQRKWGVPIPIIYDSKDNPIIEQEVFDHVAELFEQYGSNVWLEKDAKYFLPESILVRYDSTEEFTKETDIMDVWFDSGVAHSAVNKLRHGRYQADLYLEGSDQYRGWFNSSLITGTIVEGKSPFKSVVSHGFVADSKGEKMSKSLGNTITPAQVIQKNGADILRLWVASVDYQADSKIGDEILKQVSEIYRKYRNAYKFMLGNITYFDGKDIEFNDLAEIDRYILIKVDKLVDNINQYYENYEFKRVIDEVNNLLVHYLSSFYFDFTKDILYIKNIQNTRRRQIVYVLKEVLEKLLFVLTPIIPHTTNEAYQVYKDSDQEFIFLSEMVQSKNIRDEELENKYDKFLEFRAEINKQLEVARDQKLIGKSLEAHLLIKAPKEQIEYLNSIDELELMLIVSKVELQESAELEIIVSKYSEHRCERCWKYYKEEELNKEQVCHSCSDIMSEMEKGN